jgi:hypothetical protein
MLFEMRAVDQTDAGCSTATLACFAAKIGQVQRVGQLRGDRLCFLFSPGASQGAETGTPLVFHPLQSGERRYPTLSMDSTPLRVSVVFC